MLGGTLVLILLVLLAVLFLVHAAKAPPGHVQHVPADP